MCHVMSCHVMSCHVMPCHVMSCHVMSCHVMSCHVMSCHVMPCHVMSCHVMSCHVMSCHVTSCQVMSSLVKSCHFTLCNVILGKLSPYTKNDVFYIKKFVCKHKPNEFKPLADSRQWRGTRNWLGIFVPSKKKSDAARCRQFIHNLKAKLVRIVFFW
jgi:hypothetical protein